MNRSSLPSPSLRRWRSADPLAVTVEVITCEASPSLVAPGGVLDGDVVTTLAAHQAMRLDARRQEVPAMTSPAAWTTRVQDALMDAHVAFRSHAMADGLMDAREAQIDEQFVDTQQIVGEVHEEILEFCHTVRVGKRSAWHERKRREREQMFAGQA